MYAVLDRENTGAAVSSGAEDVMFWALVCEDEDWWRAEFEAMMSEALEVPRSTTRVHTAVTVDEPPGPRPRPGRVPDQRVSRPGHRNGRRWGRGRSPP